MDTDKMKKATAQNNTNSNSNSNANSTTADSKNKKGPVFMFGGNSNGVAPPGWPDQESMAAATAGFFTDGASWEAIRRTYGVTNGDDDGENDCMPDLDDMREIFSKAILSGAATAQDAKPQASDVQTTGVDAATTATAAAAAAAGIIIAPAEWESLEQVAIDDALEAEDRERKSSKKRDKKQRKKMKQKEEASQKAVEAAQKKRDKAILSWRSRVVSACQSGELSKLDSLLQESPLLRKQQPMYPSSSPDTTTTTTTATTEELRLTRSSIVPHLEFMLPNIIAKNRAQLERGKETRHRLATYILSADVPIAFTPLRSGRSALHAACFHGDLPFVQLVLEKVTEYDDTHSYSVLPESCLNGTCDDSGWAPLHYAAVSGSTDVLELLLANGCDVTTMTDDTHTWRER
jgi:ankyrin repeat protein